MGAFTLDDFKSELQFELDNRTTTTDPDSITDARLTRWINWAYLHISQPAVFRHRELETTADILLVANQPNYSISSTTLSMKITGVESIVYCAAATWDWTSNRNKLRESNVSDYSRKVHPSGTSPSTYLIRGEELLIDPTPATSIAGNVIRLWVIREPVTLAFATDTTLFSTYWDEALLLGAKYRAYKALGELEWATDALEDYAKLINELGGRDLLTVLDDKPASGGINLGESQGLGLRLE